MKEELIIKLSLLEQQSEEIKQQLEAINGQVSDLESLKLSLEKLGKDKQEMLANLGRGIFLKTKIDDDKLFINVGSKILVRKSFPEAVEIIANQISEMENMKNELNGNMEEINANLQGLIEEARNETD